LETTHIGPRPPAGLVSSFAQKLKLVKGLFDGKKRPRMIVPVIAANFR